MSAEFHTDVLGRSSPDSSSTIVQESGFFTISERWLCPSHYCRVCNKDYLVEKCSMCINSYCSAHQEGNIFIRRGKQPKCYIHEGTTNPSEVVVKMEVVDDDTEAAKYSVVVHLQNEIRSDRHGRVRVHGIRPDAGFLFRSVQRDHLLGRDPPIFEFLHAVHNYWRRKEGRSLVWRSVNCWHRIGLADRHQGFGDD
ncbi:unnamed protein product [Nesidiocoris tenuis]|uniref:Uncharacterized protein n=1 Tax=Nesidiocoris tenuis TaxID=355587 RepID=A0A6H5HKF8_9HEMI|nr:unnamed protein product [Nesidiocoris tenuis]